MFTTTRLRVFALIPVVLMLLMAAPAPAQAPPPAPSPKEQTAAALLNPQNWPAAVVAYRELVEAEPTNPRAAFGLGVALHETGKYADAIEALTRAELQGYQPQNQVRFRIARAEARAGKVEEALSRLERLAAAGFANIAVLQAPDLYPTSRCAICPASRRWPAGYRPTRIHARAIRTFAPSISGLGSGTCSPPARRVGRSALGHPV